MSHLLLLIFHVALAVSTTLGASAVPLADVFVSGAAGEGYACYRIPALLSLDAGHYLLFAEGRVTSCNDHGFVDLVSKESTDGGRTWGKLSVVHRESVGSKSVTIGNAAPVYLGGGRILLPFCRENKAAGVLESSDFGKTWSLLANLTVPPTWTWIATGPPGSLLLPTGRVLIPANRIEADGSHGFVYYSDDGGKSWKISETSVAGGNEDQAVYMPWTQPPSLLLSLRSVLGAVRLAALSTDDGVNWSAPWKTIAEDECEASTIALPAHPHGPRLVMSSAFNAKRVNMTIHVSDDEGHTWTPTVNIYAGGSAYSSLVATGNSSVALAFERDGYARISFVANVDV